MTFVPVLKLKSLFLVFNPFLVSRIARFRFLFLFKLYPKKQKKSKLACLLRKKLTPLRIKYSCRYWRKKKIFRKKKNLTFKDKLKNIADKRRFIKKYSKNEKKYFKK